MSVGSPTFEQQAVGPTQHITCLVRGVLLVDGPDGRLAVLVERTDHYGPPRLDLEVIAVADGAAERLLAEVRARMDELDVFRGQVLTVETTEHGSQRIAFLERPSLAADERVLPAGTLERIERHVLAPTRHREALLRSGRHLTRGLLLWGPPGTGKTHTVRYLTGRLASATVIVLSGGALHAAGAFAGLARRLAPSALVLEDVDLVAQQRMMRPYGQPLLFDLMNQMDGLRADADVVFVLTTNRPDLLEPALAARPGRIDLAVEIPLPDADGRGRLLELYARGLPLELAAPDAVVARTEGVTASYIREVLRAAALLAAEAGADRVTDAHLTAALDELQGDRASLTRVLLGAAAEGRTAEPTDWLQAPGPAPYFGAPG